MNQYKKLIYIIVFLIICLFVVFLIKIKTKPNYNSQIYDEVYSEYENIFRDDENITNTTNIQTNYSIVNGNNTGITHIESDNLSQEIVIGKIIIPKIDIKYPIIKETTEEYLKIAPTKYCGPEINEIRQFMYCWA